MSAIDRLIEQFRQFPGIGPRQAKRFVYFLLTRNHRFLDELSALLQDLKKEARVCSSCFRFFSEEKTNNKLCVICRDENRDNKTLMVVEKDVDLENVEQSGVYTGRYFVLGGAIPILEKEPERRIRARELKARIAEEIRAGALKEVVLALSNNPEGDNTVRFLREFLLPFTEKNEFEFKISILGRGLSTGTELEYSDRDTIKNALESRH